MSFKTIETLEFDCDGQCGTKKIGSADTPARQRRPIDPPPGWVTISEGAVNKHFCATCWSLMSSLLYVPKRQLAYLRTLDEDELDDYDLEDRLRKLEDDEKRSVTEVHGR